MSGEQVLESDDSQLASLVEDIRYMILALLQSSLEHTLGRNDSTRPSSDHFIRQLNLLSRRCQLPPVTEPLMLLPSRLLTLLPTVCHSPTTSTSLCVLLTTASTAHLPINLLVMLIPFAHNSLLDLNQLCPSFYFTLPASTNGRDMHYDHRLCKMEKRHR